MEFLLSILLFVSILIHIFTFSYTRYLLGELSFVSENLGALFKMVVGFDSHLSDVYELERFYGDPTLSYLLDHTNAVREELEGYEEIFLLSESVEIEEEVELDGKEEA